MTRSVLWKLSVATSAQAEQAVAEHLAARYGQPAVVYTDLEKGQTNVAVYLQTKPDWSSAARACLTKELRRFEVRSKVASAKITLERLRPEDWTEAWKHHFKPLEIGARLWIRPSWSPSRTRHGQVEVILDPGMSFGTGQHPTTSFCLGEVARRCRPGQTLSLLDIGTGSGILAIAAAKLGYQPVEALDLDPESIRIARANARINKVAKTIQFRCQDLATTTPRSPRRYSVVCANLMAELLQDQRDRILARLHPHGLLVLAGILKTEFSRLQRTYEEGGLRLVKSRTEREWRSGSFVRSDV